MKLKNNPDTPAEVLVGFFVFIVLLALGIFTIVLSRENVFEKSYPLEVSFEDVGGLREGDNVFMRGVRIGSVKDIRIGDRGVTVTAKLEQPVDLHRGYRIEVQATSVLGGKFMNIHEGDPRTPRIPDDAVPEGRVPVDLIDEASEVVRRLNEAFGEGGVVANLEDSMENVNAITRDLREGKGTMGRLIREDTLYRDLEMILADLREVSGRLRSGRGTIGKLLSEDDTLYRDLSEAASSLKNVAARLESGEGTLGRLIHDDGEVYRNLDETSASLKRIAAGLERGEGTLGKLIRDEGLYNEVDQLIEELRAAVDDAREATPVTTFSSVVFGAL
ncbi:MlaD family protein [Kiritimatiella glycovorans]|uniref:Virulence factor Mce family protein n=1 Tax=Kiritimatiella glycovorans TaxID=1307763 RepID=A0A0G3EGS4_9BACT|nr:MlaD family protein [Kiritimatiella glycovorans]AKJ64010.1 virulence factor Mce family protein [Kiritimatiella glycovorans]